MFPEVQQLWNGAILVTTAHALSLIGEPLLAYEVSWDGINYSRNDSQGTRGTVTFAEGSIIGLFCDLHSEHYPHRSGQFIDAETYLGSMPEHLQAIARQDTMAYLVDDYQEQNVPIITSAFWSIGDTITASEGWDSVLKHGAHIIRLETMGKRAALVDIADDYDFSPAQIEVVRSICQRRLYTQKVPVVVKRAEIDGFLVNGTTGIDNCVELLASIGVVLER